MFPFRKRFCKILDIFYLTDMWGVRWPAQPAKKPFDKLWVSQCLGVFLGWRTGPQRGESSFSTSMVKPVVSRQDLKILKSFRRLRISTTSLLNLAAKRTNGYFYPACTWELVSVLNVTLSLQLELDFFWLRCVVVFVLCIVVAVCRKPRKTSRRSYNKTVY